MTTIYDSRVSVPLKWMVEAPRLITEMVEGNPSGGMLRRPAQIMLMLLRQVAERAAVLNDPALNDLMIRMALYEMAPGERVEAAEAQRLLAAQAITDKPNNALLEPVAKIPDGQYKPADPEKVLREHEEFLRMIADLQLDCLPAGHTILEAADLADTRVSQTVRVERTGEEYERIVHSEEAYAHQYEEGGH